MANRFPYEQLRALVIEHLQKHPAGQFAEVVSGVIQLAQSRGLYQKPRIETRWSSGVSWELEPEDFEKMPEQVRQILWRFVGQGLLVFGMDRQNPNYPFYKVTEYGHEVTSQQGAQPYDPAGFMEEFRRSNPTADQVIANYLSEAVRAFNYDFAMASAVMLGGASEQLVLLLIDAFEAAIQNSLDRTRFQDSYGWTIHSKFTALNDGLERIIASGNLSGELRQIVRRQLVGVFEHIRDIRNSAGPPHLPVNFNRNTLFVYLAVFGEYVSQVYKLIDYLQSNPAKPY